MEFCIRALPCTKNDRNFNIAYSWNDSRLTVLLRKFKSPSLPESFPSLCKMLVLSPGSSERSCCVSGMSLLTPCDSPAVHCPLPTSWLSMLPWYIGKSLNADFSRSQPWWFVSHGMYLASPTLRWQRESLHRQGWVPVYGQAGWKMLEGSKDTLSPPAPGGVGFSLLSPTAMTAGPERLKDHSCAWRRVCRNSISANESMISNGKHSFCAGPGFFLRDQCRSNPLSQRGSFFTGALPEEEQAAGPSRPSCGLCGYHRISGPRASLPGLQGNWGITLTALLPSLLLYEMKY